MNSPATVQRYRVTTMRDEGYVKDANGEFVEWEDHCRALEGLRRKHVTCFDPWYSCPKDEENPPPGEAGLGSVCNCGADEHNAKIDALIGKVNP